MTTKTVAVYTEEERKKLIAYQTTVSNLEDICILVDCQGIACEECPLWKVHCDYQALQDSILNIV